MAKQISIWAEAIRQKLEQNAARGVRSRAADLDS